MIISRTLVSETGEFAVSDNGRHLTTCESKKIIIWNSFSLEVHRTIHLVCTAFLLQFSPNSEILSFITKAPYRLNLFFIRDDHVVEIDLATDLDVVKTIWSPDSELIVYCSELGVYSGVYDTTKHEHFNLDGCSQTDTRACLIDFTPKSDYLCFTSGYQIIVYDTHSWEEVRFKAPVYPTVLKCSNSYTIVFANNEGVFRVYTLFGLIVLDEKLLPTSCVKTVRFSSDWRSLYVATYDNKTLIYDAICWRRIAEINVESYFEERIKSYQIENEGNFVELVPLIKTGFSELTDLKFKCVKNAWDELKIKTASTFRIIPSPDGQFIATYHPGIKPSCSVWIWRLTNTRYLEAVICLKSSKLSGLRWHHRHSVLAVVSDSETVFWEPGGDKLVTVRVPSVKFRWVKNKRKIGVISSDSAGWLVYFN